MALRNCCLIGRGKVYLREYVSPYTANTNPLLHVGNVSVFKTSLDKTELEVKDFTKASGNDCSTELINKVNVELTFHCHDPKNLARAVVGNLTDVAAGSITNETHTVHALDSFIPLNRLPSGSVVVTNVGGGTTYVAGTDYLLTGAGLEIPATSTIPLASQIEVDYAYGIQSLIDMITSTSKEYEIVMDGFNADSGSAYKVHLYRAKLNAAEEMNFISEEYNEFTISGEALKDSSRAGQYGSWLI